MILEGEKLKHAYLYQFPLGTRYSEVIAHVARVSQLHSRMKLIVYQSGVRDLIVEEFQNIGIKNVEDIVLTDANKEEVPSNLKIHMKQCAW